MLFGLDENMSLWDQYVDYWKLLLHGDLGLSFTFFPAPVAEVIRQALPWTIGLVGVATIISFMHRHARSAPASAGGAAPGWTGCCR